MLEYDSKINRGLTYKLRGEKLVLSKEEMNGSTSTGHISQTTWNFEVIQVGGESLFQELSNDRSYA